MVVIYLNFLLMSYQSTLARSTFFPRTKTPGPDPPTWIRDCPFDVWHHIWSLVPPKTRMERMFELCTRSSFLAALFEDMPSLWTDWFISPRSGRLQSPSFRCARRIWLWYYGRDNRSSPIRLHATSEAVWVFLIPAIIPASVLSSVQHITINFPPALLDEPSIISNFFGYLPSLQSIDLTAGNYLVYGSRHIWLEGIPVNDDCIPNAYSLTALRLTGALPSSQFPDAIDLTSLTSLIISNLVVSSVTDTVRLRDIVGMVPNLLDLVITSTEDQYVDSRFWVPPPRGFGSLIPFLRSIRVAGHITHLYKFLSTVCADSSMRLEDVDATFHCLPSSSPFAIFDSIPEFRAELTWRADTIGFGEAPYTITTRRNPTSSAPMRWAMRWILLGFTPGSRIWVSVTVYYVLYRSSFVNNHAHISSSLFIQPVSKLSGISRAFYSALSRALAVAGPHVRVFDQTASTKFVNIIRPWCLSPTISLSGDSSVLLKTLEVIATRPWLFPNLHDIYFFHASRFNAQGRLALRDKVLALCSNGSIGYGGGRVIGVHIRARVVECLDDGRDFFWESFEWRVL